MVAHSRLIIYPCYFEEPTSAVQKYDGFVKAKINGVYFVSCWSKLEILMPGQWNGEAGLAVDIGFSDYCKVY